MNRSTTRTITAVVLAIGMMGAFAPVSNADVGAEANSCEHLEDKEETTYISLGYEDADRTSASWFLYNFLDGQNADLQDWTNGIDARVIDLGCIVPEEAYNFAVCEEDPTFSDPRVLPTLEESVYEMTFFEFDGDRISVEVDGEEQPYKALDPVSKCEDSNDFPVLLGEIPEDARYAVITLDQGTPIGVQTTDLAGLAYTEKFTFKTALG